ncbi:MAG TPA: cation diffusion facilitator family transporter [Candidatus Limnocylindrales bacterium]|nr:cation diffusion facilitator family transporter [Candidatus Limnocylindrales bacterium]
MTATESRLPTAAARHAPSMAGALMVSIGILVVELIAGIASNSLALLADAAHVFADVSGIALALVAVRLAARPRSDARTFGLYRLEIVAAAANALLLLGIAAFVFYEGLRRLIAPPEVEAGLMTLVAAGAIVANLISVRLLSGGRDESLTVRGAYLEVLGDLLGSTAVLVAGLIVLATGWQQADALASLVVAVLIVPRTVTLLRDSLDVLLEATPRNVDLERVRKRILEAPGVNDVHDLHAWTITSGMNVVSAHVVLKPDGQPGDVLDFLATCLADDYDVRHSTFQLETAEHVAWEARGAHVRH